MSEAIAEAKVTGNILDNFERALKRNINILRIDEISITGMVREILSNAKSIEEKLACISKTSTDRKVSFICGKRWSILNTNGYLSISRVGGRTAVSYMNGSITIANGEYKVIFNTDKVIFKSPTFTVELYIRNLDKLKEKKHLIKIVLSKIITVSKDIDNTLAKCIKINGIRC